MFARRTRAEVVACQEDPSAGYPGPIQHERRVLQPPVVRESPVVEERLGQALLVGHLQVARRHDLVGVDVVCRKRDGPAGEGLERLGHVSWTGWPVQSRSPAGCAGQ